MSDNLDAWTKAHDSRVYFAQRLADCYINGDTDEIERYATLYRIANETMNRLDREYMGEQK